MLEWAGGSIHAGCIEVCRHKRMAGRPHGAGPGSAAGPEAWGWGGVGVGGVMCDIMPSIRGGHDVRSLCLLSVVSQATRGGAISSKNMLADQNPEEKRKHHVTPLLLSGGVEGADGR